MANKNLLMYGAQVTQVEQFYFAPVATLPAPLSTAISTVYCFLAHVTPWDDDNNPPEVYQDQKSIKNIYNTIFAAKQVYSSDISPVVERYDWITGRSYDYYRDDVDMFERNQYGNLVLRFYVRNKYDQVFMCLWNNNGADSTQEPYFQPGSYGTNNIYTGTDGYKWKYIYTIDVGTKQKFMDANWIPVPVGTNIPNSIENSAGRGNIDVINILDGGSNYDPANASITISITGDGSGATATASSSNGEITGITVTNTGGNYTYANVSVVSANGSGAIAIAPVSPIGGHGFDPISQLGCNHVMFTAEFNGDEGGIIPTDIDYRQIGLLINPTALSTYPNPANGSIYKVSTDLIVAPGFSQYVPDETIYQGTSLETATYTATVLSFDTSTNIIHTINITGTPTLNAPVYSAVSGTTRTLLTVNSPDFQSFSGYLTYVENRTGIQRSSDGIEQFRFVLGY